MALGGNKKMKEFFQNYDLAEEQVSKRYSTRAADFYRAELVSKADGVLFAE